MEVQGRIMSVLWFSWQPWQATLSLRAESLLNNNKEGCEGIGNFKIISRHLNQRLDIFSSV